MCLVVANIIMRPRDLPPKKPVKTLPLLGGFLRQKSTWFGCLGAAFVMMGMFVPLFYIQGELCISPTSGLQRLTFTAPLKSSPNRTELIAWWWIIRSAPHHLAIPPEAKFNLFGEPTACSHQRYSSHCSVGDGQSPSGLAHSRSR